MVSALGGGARAFSHREGQGGAREGGGARLREAVIITGEARNAAMQAAKASVTGVLQDILDKTVRSSPTQHASELVVYVAKTRLNERQGAQEAQGGACHGGERYCSRVDERIAHIRYEHGLHKDVSREHKNARTAPREGRVIRLG